MALSFLSLLNNIRQDGSPWRRRALFLKWIKLASFAFERTRSVAIEFSRPWTLLRCQVLLTSADLQGPRVLSF